MLVNAATVWSTAITGRHSLVAGGLNHCFIYVCKGDPSGAWILSYKNLYILGVGGIVSILILVKIIQLQNCLKQKYRFNFPATYSGNLETLVSRPNEFLEGRRCSVHARLGWVACAGGGGSPASCFLSNWHVLALFQLKLTVNWHIFCREKSGIGKFPTSSTPLHTDCKPTTRDGWHLPLLFYRHVDLPWCGAEFSTNTHVYLRIGPAILPYPGVFEISIALPAVKE